MSGHWNLPLNHHGPNGAHKVHNEEIVHATEVGNINCHQRGDRKRGRKRRGGEQEGERIEIERGIERLIQKPFF